MNPENPTRQPTTAIVMENVSAGSLRDSGQVIARDVNWTVNPGEFWVVAGLQGSGKSDFLMMTAGLMPPLGGTYRFLGETMPIFEEHRLAHRLKLGLVFDGGQLFNHLTVSENVALPLRYHLNLGKGQAHERVAGLLERTGLQQWADSTPGAVGRNWLKRVGLARALILQPEVLLVDNPLGGLDPRHEQWWLRFLDELRQGSDLTAGKPVTLVVTASSLRPWQSQASHLAVLQDRQFQVLGSWQQARLAASGTASSPAPWRELLDPERFDQKERN